MNHARDISKIISIASFVSALGIQVLFIGCKEPAQDVSPSPSETASSTANPVDLSIPVPSDFAEQASAAITADNYKTVLDGIALQLKSATATTPAGRQ